MLLVTLGISMWFAALNVAIATSSSHSFMIQLGLGESCSLPVIISLPVAAVLALNPLSRYGRIPRLYFPQSSAGLEIDGNFAGHFASFLRDRILYFRKAERTLQLFDLV